ncbi:MAG: response regulator transcription factor [Marinilabiliales bacterium]
MNKTRILIAEDDKNLGMLLKEYLIAKDFDADLYDDGDKAFQGFNKNQYHLCILDVMMPVKDGFTLAKEIRLINSDIPIIFLTAKSLKQDVLEGFKIGADDYMTKPFSMEELLLRIEAILKRTGILKDSNESSFKIGDYLFDSQKQQLTYQNQAIKLTTKESELLRLLCLHKNKVLDRTYALNTVWGDDSYYNARSMDVYITKLRKKLAKDPSIEIINVHGKGFKLISK